MTEISKTLEYSESLYADVTADALDYWQQGETVCGAEDPAVISLGPEFATRRPDLAAYSVCRVHETYVSASKSDTFLTFSNEEITGAEYQRWDDLMED